MLITIVGSTIYTNTNCLHTKHLHLHFQISLPNCLLVVGLVKIVFFDFHLNYVKIFKNNNIISSKLLVKYGKSIHKSLSLAFFLAIINIDHWYRHVIQYYFVWQASFKSIESM